MGIGKSVRIYLADGSVSGIRHAEIVNWTGQAFACSRAQFSVLRDWPETRRPGIYFLFGVEEQSGRDALYIGEAEVLIDRLSSHINGKDFWNEVIAFTSKDDNLTKAHVRYLEARLIQCALEAGRYSITNTVSPQLPSLPRADRDAMEEFIAGVRVLLGVLGHRALEALIKRPLSSTSKPSTTESPTIANGPNGEVTGPESFSFNIAGIRANAVRTDEGIVVLAGSYATSNPAPSMSSGNWSLREKLLASGVITPSEGKLAFVKDYLFNSPSQAAGIIVGYSINGREAWKNLDGKTWGQIETQSMSQT